MDDQSHDLDGLNDAAFCHRVTCYLDGDVSPDDLHVLDVELQADANKRAAFVRLCLVRVALIRRGAAARAEQPAADATAALDDAMILPALRETDDGSDHRPPTPGPAAAAAERAAPPKSTRLAHRWAYGAGIAAVFALGFGLQWALRQSRSAEVPGVAIGPPAFPNRDEGEPPRPPPPSPLPPLPPPPAVVTATAGVAVDGPGALVPRSPLANGSSVRLAAGAVELTFASGAVVLVRAPADVRVVDRDEMVVNAGAVYAHVPPAAHGFRVIAPGLDVVDRGTNFGVRTGATAAAAEVHVFEGLVEATGVDTGGQPTAASVRVTTGQAVSHAEGATEAEPVPVPFAPVGFDRNIADIRIALAVHGTGAGLAAGIDDPNWQLVSMPGQPAGKPRPAVVLVNPRADYAVNGPAASWIAPTARLSNAAPGEYVYRTTLDLTGYNAASVSVRAVMSADDGITAVRVNGTPVAIPPSSLRQATWKSVADAPLAAATWRSGPNQFDVVVNNGATPGGRMNPTGLLFGWTVTAAPLVRR